MSISHAPYIGRFAPSPTGHLHFGSLIAAVASYCQARAHNGQWLLRMEDVDQTRVVKGSADSILKSLEHYGFEWDGPVDYQSQRNELYQAALEQLQALELIYACDCSRKKLKEANSPIYPGYCRQRHLKPDSKTALRLTTDNREIVLTDKIQHVHHYQLSRDCGDFIIKRRDQLFAYQLAVVVDDAMQGVTDVIRGADLLDATPQQIYLQQLLGYPTPSYSHLPIAMHQQGRKLSKSHQDLPINSALSVDSLYQALLFLGQQPPAELKKSNLTEFWGWTLDNWSLAQIPAVIQKPGMLN